MLINIRVNYVNIYKISPRYQECGPCVSDDSNILLT